MKVSFNVLGTAVTAVGCAFLMQSCSDTTPIDTGAPASSMQFDVSNPPAGATTDLPLTPLSKTVVESEDNIILNGGFEDNGGNATTSIDNWTIHTATPGSSVNTYAMSSTTLPLSGHSVPTPPEGDFAAVSDQTGVSNQLFYQDFVVPPGGATLTFELYVNNQANAWYDAGTLSWTPWPSQHNEHFRVDIISTDANLESTTDVLQNLYYTDSEHAFTSGYSTVTAEISEEFAGQTVRLRFGQVQTAWFFHVGVDNVCVVPNAIPVDLDVKPGSSTNPINVGSNGTFPVAILGSDDLDVTTIDVASILLGDGNGSGTGVNVKKNGSLHYSIEDVDGDGDMDLMMHFSVSAMVANGDLSSTSTALSVSGETSDDEVIVGEDIISIVP